MSAIAARRYNYDQAGIVVKSLERILNRINKANYPGWLINELETSQHHAQCIQGDRMRVMREFGDEI